MGTLRKLFKSKDQSPTAKTVKMDLPKRIPDKDRSSFSPRNTAKNNRRRTRGRKMHYQTLSIPNHKGKRAIKHVDNESY